MPLEAPRKQNAGSKVNFRGSLVRTVVAWLLVLSLVPVLLMGGVTYLRTRAMLRDQLTNQVRVVIDNYAKDLEDFATARATVLESLSLQPGFANSLTDFLHSSYGTPDYLASRDRIMVAMKAASNGLTGRFFDELIIVNPMGQIILSTNPAREMIDLSSGNDVASMLGKNGTQMMYLLQPFSPSDMSMVTTRQYVQPDTQEKFTLLGISTNPTLQNVLVQSAKFYNGSRAFFFNRSDAVIGLSTNGSWVAYQNFKTQLDELHKIIASNQQAGIQEYQSQDNLAVLAYGRWIPSIGMGLVLEVPSITFYQQIQLVGPFNLIILIAALLITSVSVFFGASSIVRPLSTLAAGVQSFAQGNWEHRVNINRRDEIGLLAHSFNTMAEELGRLYRSLEQKVDERNRQIVTAAEVGQITTSTTDREEILQSSTNLLVDRFGYDYVCLSLLDSSQTFFTNRAESGRLAKGQSRHSFESRIRNQSIFGQVIATKKVEVLGSVDETGNRPDSLLEGAAAQVVLPILAGNQLLGILDIQSAQAEAFGPDVVSVLRMVATQIANGLRNIQLVENAQVDLKETALLYQASRQITRAQSREEIWQSISQAILQTPYLSMLLTADGDQLKATAVIDPSVKRESQPPTIILTLQRFIAQLTSQAFLIFDHLNQPSEFFPILSWFEKHGCTSVAIVPVLVNGKLERVFVLGSRGEKPFTPAALQPYLNLAEVVSNTEQRFEVMRNLEENLTEMRTVAAVSQAISVETDLEVLYQQLHQSITEATGGGSLDFYIALYNAETEMISFPYLVEGGSRQIELPVHIGEGITAYVLRTQQPLLLSTNAAQKTAALGIKIIGLPSRSWAGVPLMLGGQILGAMVAEDLEVEGRLSERELHLLTTLAPQVAVAIRNAQLLSEMQSALKAYDQERFLLNTLIENLPDVVYFKDTSGRYMRVSKSLVQKRGLSSWTEMVGKTDVELLPGDPVAEAIHNEELEIIASGQPSIGKLFTLPLPDGSTAWTLNSRLPILNGEGQAAGLLAIAHDITELKKTEQIAQKRAQQLLATAEIARDTSGTLNVAELLEKSINLVRDRFGFYHASIFLVDALNQFAVLRESTGEAGRQMKAAGHRLAVGSTSIVGQTTGMGEAIVINDVTQTANYYANPLLPLTRSEMALPLKAGERVIGALDVQSTEANAFGDEDVNILRILADQLAVAIVNADLFSRSEENIAKHRFLHQITTGAAAATTADEALSTVVQGLKTALGSDRVTVYLPDPHGVLEVRASAGYEGIDLSQARVSQGEGTVGLAFLGRHPVLVKDTQADIHFAPLDESVRSQLAVPILYTDRAIGVVCIESTQLAAYDENDQEILGSLGNTLGAILANTQLMSQVRQQIEQQRQIFEITSKIRRSTDIETILRTSARELATALRAQRANIRIMTAEEPVAAAERPNGSNGPNGHNSLDGHNGHKGTNGHHGLNGHKEKE